MEKTLGRWRWIAVNVRFVLNIELFKYLNNWVQDCTKHIFITITDSFSSHVFYVFYALLLLVPISKSPNSFEFIYFSLCVNRFINCVQFCKYFVQSGVLAIVLSTKMWIWCCDSCRMHVIFFFLAEQHSVRDNLLCSNIWMNIWKDTAHWN